MRLPAAVLLALVLSSATAGCIDTNLAQWWRDEGTVHINLLPLPPDASDIDHFRSLILTVYSVGLRVAATDDRGTPFLDRQEFYFDPPLRVEFVGNATEGHAVPLLQTVASTRAIQQVVVRVSVNESQLSSGREIPGCHQGIEAQDMCVRVARDGTYTIPDPAFTPPPGRTAVFGVPMGVHFNPSLGEYYLRAEVGRLRTE